ncbi:hypothetical protein LY625_12330 [Lysobacter sp. GX 14042]|uniref:YkvI family membrane protein n=1 Tax=Lysobacter sp. GX 14042 TaxID=2907155 RepID=UPI001F3F6C40|nr:hypothetical protein [Lysobacter sp. GX 14042]MCE7033388.1 hypothetical protein [Lysobacter sp. GX 14042]
MFKRALGIGMAFIGLIVGAGFASGQEMLQFFVAFGTRGIVGALIASVLMIISGIAALQLGSYLMAKEHTVVFRRVSNPWVAWFLDATTIVTLFSIGFVMFAGGGSNMAQQFDWPVWIGAGLTLLAVLVAGMADVQRVSTIIGAITPFIILFMVGVSAWMLLTSDYDIAALNLATGEVQTSLPNWWVAALNYVGLCAITAVSMTIVIGGSMLDTRAAGLGGLIGGVMYLVLLLLAVVALYLQVDIVGSDELPMLALVNAVHPWLGAAMSVVIFGMIFNTALGMFYALGKRLTRDRPERFRIVYIASVLVGFALSFVGFRDLVSYVYPALGYLGLVLIVVMAVGWMRRRRRIGAEIARRRRLHRLAMRHLDPAREFSPEHATEVRRITRESNLPDAELREAVLAEVDAVLRKDPEVDYPPPDGEDPEESRGKPGA